MPLRLAVRDGLVEPHTTVLDYGSGRGQDVARLTKMGFHARGWDPYFANHHPLQVSDTVLMTYVLNVIEHPAERRRCLEQAWELTKSVMVVSTRLAWDRRRVRGEDAFDGIVTSRATFQHLFTPAELRTLVQDVTRTPPVAPAPGVVYAFKQDHRRLAYVGRSVLPDFAWADPETTAEAIGEVTSFAHRHGRIPSFEEIPESVVPLLGRLSRAELVQLVTRSRDPEQYEAGARRSVLDALLVLAMARFSGRTKLSDLPLTLQLDIRAHFRSFREACLRAERLLLKLRDDSYVRGAMRNSVGKLTPSALYVHRRAFERMPTILKLYEFCGSIGAGRPHDWNILKLHHDSRRVAWSSYPDFDSNPHPRISWSYGVHLGTLDTKFQEWSPSNNRPLLHRKHEFLASEDAHYAKYKRLTDAEVRAGLYMDPSRIGLEAAWEETLAARGVELRGHRLVRSRST